MKIFHIDEDVFRMLPDYYVGVVAAEGLVNRQDNPAVADRLDQAIAAFADDFQGINLKEDPHIVPYRNAFRLMGINPNKYLCSIEALAKRVQKKKALPHNQSGRRPGQRHFLGRTPAHRRPRCWEFLRWPHGSPPGCRR